MIRELLESLKYVGHHFAVCFLRVYLGFYVLNLGLSKFYGSYLFEPMLAAQINENLNLGQTPAGIDYFFLELVRPYWHIVSNLQSNLEVIAGILLILGFLVRPVVIFLILYFWIFSFIEVPVLWPWYGLFFASLFSIGWAGAGRCFGIDYYFYKRYRGFLW